MDHKVFALMAVLLFADVRLAHASLGQTELPATPTDGPVTVYYLSRDAERSLKRGRMVLNLAAEGQPVPGNGRLVVISHGSGGSPWVHADLARALTDAGFIVGLAAQLTGGMLDGPKREIALMVIRRRFSDERLRSDFDPRIAAVVAGVPTAADFDPDSLIKPRVPLAHRASRRSAAPRDPRRLESPP
jgi:predicted dienelactone hydrolase